ncbi:Kinetochore protein Spc24 [Exophiala dermatitidis]|uniref:Kinetochore protein Spc24 n=1 Tax=Exophiala dermatitidis TaxID=5970 RepID=A0AAN6ESB3_EXODE|nr:Kinetochore protein Spc24 [Exophiala dermatitidis]KAJ4514023.1 Kinetochore protein Spc24 [Exophiala dermatitidis]KAJ4515495.1 Kinetochore protein Spc24 [Exophiala dermatitidis]KAJ4535903.1 Kinetochore protein Spc24 [Exophiala dermatitidis]KAJ4541025.1 Kinetochore protein Spc24 [Exophiala dermatitidis]
MARDLLSSDGSDSEDASAEVQAGELKVNEEFARRFEYNKKREEMQRLEDKLGKTTTGKRKRDDEDDDTSDDDSELSSETEDEGELVTETIDKQIMETINAIRSKDPRVYDSSAKFYTEEDDETQTQQPKPKKEKPMHLQDYHRQNLLNGITTTEEEDQDAPMTYTQEQEHLKKSIVSEIHAAAAAESEEEAEKGDDDFLVAKPKEKQSQTEAKQQQVVTLDVENADKDPETFLSNFMVSRAWAAPTDPNLHPFESDDDEEERRADEFEEAYNLRFEDPEKSNEKLRSHARDLAEKYSVRRKEVNPRQKKREAEKARKEAEKQQRKEEKARLRKLKIEELEEKVKKIKQAAGLKTKDIRPEDWAHLVEEDWDDAKWEEEMQKRFGDEYYAEQEAESDEDNDETNSDKKKNKKKKKIRKPKFDDDIDIKDIVPDFEEEELQKPAISLSDADEGEAEDEAEAEDSTAAQKKKQMKKSELKKLKEEEKRDAKKERRIIEQLVDHQLQFELESSLLPSQKKQKQAAGGFRYRETSPKSFGLTARDILLADDKQLNEFAGLKKLASFRDPEKKRKDAKHLGKKARLRKWRLETFGSEEGVQASELVPAEPKPQQAEAGPNAEADDETTTVDIRTSGKKKRRRKNKNKTAAQETEA